MLQHDEHRRHTQRQTDGIQHSLGSNTHIAKKQQAGVSDTQSWLRFPLKLFEKHDLCDFASLRLNGLKMRLVTASYESR